MITPNPLYPGARVALLAPSSAVEAQRLPAAVDAVKALGLEPVPYPSCYAASRHGYFAADDAQRAADLQAAFADDTMPACSASGGATAPTASSPCWTWMPSPGGPSSS